ncbi:MAG: phosphoribosylanthranilate isomerase [Pseudomonadota bacterium]
MVRVKICGITNTHDAQMAVKFGADALGFIFAPSPRQVTPETVRSIIDSLPPFVQTVGVFVNEALETIRDIMRFCCLHLVQLHGDEPPAFCRKVIPPPIKAFRLNHESNLLSIRNYLGCISAVHLDSYQKGIKGGTGKTFDWQMALKAKALGIPVILSGGLGPSNIQRAISVVKPYAVDVNSGIELSPGKKSPVLMKAVMETVGNMNSKGMTND